MFSINIYHRPHLPEVRVGRVGVVSPHGALRAYTVLLTAEPPRGSLMMLSLPDYFYKYINIIYLNERAVLLHFLLESFL